jgi:hypothetical protein
MEEVEEEAAARQKKEEKADGVVQWRGRKKKEDG